MKKKPKLIPLLNFFAETLRETLEESALSQAEIARRCGIPAPHLTQMKQGKRRCTPVSTEAEILADYPDLETADLKVVQAYAARLSRIKRFELIYAA